MFLSALRPLRITASAGYLNTTLELVRRQYTKIYTKTGDKGTSALFTGVRKPKDNAVFEALGATDELSCHIGFSACYKMLDPTLLPLAAQLERLISRVGFNETRVQQLEKWIDDMTAQLPPLKNFILPSGGKSASHLHLARAVCRRAERQLVPLSREGEVDLQTSVFMNRLSDYLFTAARFAALKEGREEKIYRSVSSDSKPK